MAILVAVASVVMPIIYAPLQASTSSGNEYVTVSLFVHSSGCEE